MIYRCTSLTARIILKLFFRLEIIGINFVPSQGAFILASNHASFIDPIVLGAVSPRRLNFLAKEELFRMPLFSWYLLKLGAFPLKRKRADFSALKASIKKLRQKEPLVVFPEGTRSQRAKKVYAGVGLLVNKTGAPVVPAKIYNTDIALPTGRIFPRFKKIKIVFGKPLVFDRDKTPERIAKDVLSCIHSL